MSISLRSSNPSLRVIHAAQRAHFCAGTSTGRRSVDCTYRILPGETYVQALQYAFVGTYTHVSLASSHCAYCALEKFKGNVIRDDPAGTRSNKAVPAEGGTGC